MFRSLGCFDFGSKCNKWREGDAFEDGDQGYQVVMTLNEHWTLAALQVFEGHYGH